jgi:hypothetical protein
MDEKQTPRTTTRKMRKINLHNERAQTFFFETIKRELPELPTPQMQTKTSALNVFFAR